MISHDQWYSMLSNAMIWYVMTQPMTHITWLMLYDIRAMIYDMHHIKYGERNMIYGIRYVMYDVTPCHNVICNTYYMV